MKQLIISLVIALFITTTASAQLYKWTDENGVTHYTNTKPPDAAMADAVKQPEFKDKKLLRTTYVPKKSTVFIPGEKVILKRAAKTCVFLADLEAFEAFVRSKDNKSIAIYLIQKGCQVISEPIPVTVIDNITDKYKFGVNGKTAWVSKYDLEEL